MPTAVGHAPGVWAEAVNNPQQMHILDTGGHVLVLLHLERRLHLRADLLIRATHLSHVHAIGSAGRPRYGELVYDALAHLRVKFVVRVPLRVLSLHKHTYCIR